MPFGPPVSRKRPSGEMQAADRRSVQSTDFLRRPFKVNACRLRFSGEWATKRPLPCAMASRCGGTLPGRCTVRTCLQKRGALLQEHP